MKVDAALAPPSGSPVPCAPPGLAVGHKPKQRGSAIDRLCTATESLLRGEKIAIVKFPESCR